MHTPEPSADGLLTLLAVARTGRYTAAADRIDELLGKAAEAIDIDRLWANPDGGLKPRHYWQLDPSLRNLVAAARRLRRRAGSD